MKEEILKPLNNKKENFFVAVFVFIIIILAVFFIKYTNKDKDEFKLNNNEISSFDSFNNTENLIYSELENFLFELSYYDKVEEYPSIDELEENHIYPFVKDSLWESRGKILWEKYTENGKNIYLGISQNTGKIGNFLIESIEKDEGIETLIYYSKEKILNKNIIIDKVKEKYSFKKVVALKGEKLTEDIWK